ncbi:MAG: FAD-dependent oxidoreductase, partial [Candidatus Omnitrophota bacterium]
MYDLAIIGAGPAGYTAAKRAAELDAQVCIIEKEQLGGICLNKGCIPVKFMVNTASLLSSIKKSGQFGIDTESYRLNITKMLERREFIIDKHRRSIERLLNRSKAKIIRGEAKLKDPNTVNVSGESIKAKYIIIATGSIPVETDKLKFDHSNIISSADILNLKEVPSSLIIVGAGYIGCEFACIYNQFGCDVTIIEIEPQIHPKQDKKIARRLMQSMKKRGIKII